MARYLWKVSYSVDGAKGLIAEGGTARRATIQKLLQERRRQARHASTTPSARTTPT